MIPLDPRICSEDGCYAILTPEEVLVGFCDACFADRMKQHSANRPLNVFTEYTIEDDDRIRVVRIRHIPRKND